MTKWRPITNAQKKIVSRVNAHEHGAYILAWPVFGQVARVRWWQADDKESRDRGYENFIEDGGNAVRPTHWMPLPKPPKH